MRFLYLSKMKNIKIIAFDADDTLWENEHFFRETEGQFCALLEDYLPHKTVAKELFKIEMQNLALYGYGIKGFMLSMIETILEITNGTVNNSIFQKTLDLGKKMLHAPVILIDDVEEVLRSFTGKYRIVLATKGDLLDQERKLIKSGLEKYFHHIEVMSNKKETDYKKLLTHLDCKPSEFLMIGNSLKSDILPVLNLGGNAIHIPFHTTWVHEQIEHKIKHENFKETTKIKEILQWL